MVKIFNIDIDCPNCADKCEKVISKVDGVTNVKINFLTSQMTLEANDNDYDKVLKKAIKQARKIEPDFDVEM